MTDFHRAVSRFSLIVLLLSHLSILRAQTPSADQPQPLNLPEFLDRMKTTAAAESTWKDFENIDIAIRQAPAPELSNQLPTVIAALTSTSDTVQRYAGLVLLAVSTRTDSADLLRPYVPQLTALLHSPKDYMRRGAITIFSMLKPNLPPEGLPPLLAFVREVDQDSETQAAALSVLLRAKPDNESIIQATQQFMSRPLDATTRVTALNAIHTSRVKDIRIQHAVVVALDDSHPGVQLAAIAALNRMGPPAIARALPALARLSQNENADVSTAARKVLARLPK